MKTYIGWIEKDYANKPFIWKTNNGAKELCVTDEGGVGIKVFKNRYTKNSDEVLIKITIERVKKNAIR